MRVPIMLWHQYEFSELQSLLGEYHAARRIAGAASRGHITLQTTVYLAETSARARAEAEASTLHERKVAILHRSGGYADAEAAARAAALAPAFKYHKR